MVSYQGQPDPSQSPGVPPGQQPGFPQPQGWGGPPPQIPVPGLPPGPPRNPQRKRPKGGRVVIEVVGGIVLLFLGVAIGSAGKSTPSASNTGSASSSAPAQAAAATSPPASPGPVTPSPNGTYQGSCDYTLANDPAGNNYLIGEVDFTNTGNIGTIVKVTITWPQEGYAPVKAHKTVRVPYGANGLQVRFHVNAGSIDSGSQVIDLLQSYQNSHSGDGCTYNAKIVSTFGSAH